MYASMVGPIQAATSDLLAEANGSMRITYLAQAAPSSCEDTSAVVLAAASLPPSGTRAHTRSVMNSRTARATSGELETAWVSVTNGFPLSASPSSH
jgi:hypothetical protein